MIVGAIFAIRGGTSSSVSCFRSNVSATIDRQGTTVVCVMASAPTLSHELCMMQQWAGSSPLESVLSSRPLAGTKALRLFPVPLLPEVGRGRPPGKDFCPALDDAQSTDIAAVQDVRPTAIISPSLFNMSVAASTGGGIAAVEWQQRGFAEQESPAQQSAGPGARLGATSYSNATIWIRRTRRCGRFGG